MGRDELRRTLADWIGEILEGAAPALDDATDLVADLALDSLALAELAARLRATFKIRLKPGELAADLRVGKVLDLVMSRLSA